MTPTSVTVFSPDGAPEIHTRPNARDLVAGAGYTWIRGVPASPSQYAPFATFTPPAGPDPSQRVLDSVGQSSAAQAAQGAAAAAAAQAQAAAAAQAQAALQFQAQQQFAAQQAAEAAAAAYAAQQAEIAAKAALVLNTPEPAPVDYSQAPAVDSSDLDTDVDADAPAEDETTVSKTPRRRGGRKN